MRQKPKAASNILRAKKEEKEVAVTFDSAWGNEDLDEIPTRWTNTAVKRHFL